MANRMLTLGIPSGLGVKPNRIPGLQGWYDASRLQIGAAQFTATNSEYLSVADHADLRTGDIDFWVAQWAYLDDAAWAPLVGKWDAPQNEYMVGRLGGAPNTFVFYVRDAANTVDTTLNATTFGVPPQRTWCFVLAWHDSVNNTLNIQINNGVVDSVAYALGLPVGASASQIGNNAGASLSGRVAKAAFGKNPVGGIAGIISTISSRLYNNGAGLHHSQLTAAEATAWGLISYWNLNENGGQRNDSTANAHHLTDNNTVSCAPSMTPETPADGTLVYIAEDLSGNGNHATQATEASKLAYKVNIINGRPVLRGDGVADCLRADGIATALTGSDVAFTIVTVCKPRVLPASFIWGLGRAASDNSFMRLTADATPNWAVRRQDDTAAGKNMALGTPVAGTTAIVTVVFTGTLGRLYVDGAQVGADTDLDVGAMTVDQFTVGGLTRTGVDGVFDGDIPEMVVYNRALSASEIARLSRYLGRRYGIAVS